MLGAAAVMLLTGGALAQPRLDQTQLSDAQAAPADVRMADGKVVDVERRPNMVTMLKLRENIATRVHVIEMQAP